ncbi:MAG TPA: YtxH domain-containing protein [Verrucomicrobiae bacterium]|nr:YtxH domain-containing protein [Verrucomicrobiae bacterium]
MPTAKKKSSAAGAVGAGIAAGAILGLAAGLFLQSKKGKEMTKDARKKAMVIQKQVMKRLNDTGEMTKETYEKIVDDVVKYYAKSKEIAAKEVPEVRAFLLSKWKEIDQAMKEA